MMTLQYDPLSSGVKVTCTIRIPDRDYERVSKILDSNIPRDNKDGLVFIAGHDHLFRDLLPQAPKPSTCNCTIQTLMAKGCQCGAPKQ